MGLHGKNHQQQVLNTPPQVVLDTSDLEKIESLSSDQLKEAIV